jgi:hypothetical protein
MSEGLLNAVLAVQAEAPTLLKEKTATVKSDKGSYKYTYTSLDAIVEKIGPILNKHGLVWLTLPTRDDRGEPALNYRLCHAATGEVIEGTMPLMLSKADPQGLGSALTYCRRYSLCAVLNLVADDDDDGHAARSSHPGEPTPAQMMELGRQVKTNRPGIEILRAMLDGVGATNISDVQIEDGTWATQVSRTQVSGLLDMFKSGSLPTGGSDIPNDDDEAFAELERRRQADDLPFDAVDAEREA